MTVWAPGEDASEGRRCCWDPSVDFQDLSLWQSKPAFVLVKELDQGVHVHAVVEVHFLLRWVVDLWNGDGLTHWWEKEKGEIHVLGWVLSWRPVLLHYQHQLSTATLP